MNAGEAGRAESAVVPDLSVIIPTLGRELLRESLARLLAGTHRPGEVIVVHQGDDPAVRDWIEELTGRGLVVRYLHSEERGRARGVNQGIAAARTRFVAITDDDCLVAEDWVARVSEELRADPERIVTGQVLAAGTEPVLGVNTTPERYRQVRPRLKFDVLSGGNVAMSRSVIERVGLFDDDPVLATAEDGEYAYRALRSGVAIEFVPDIVVEHWGWRSEDERVRQYHSYALSQGGFYGKYLRRLDGFIALRVVRHAARAFLSFVIAWVRGDRELMRASRAQSFTIWRGVARGLRSAGRPPALLDGRPGRRDPRDHRLPAGDAG